MGAQSGAAIPGQSEPGKMAMKGYSAFPNALISLEHHHHIV